MSHVAPLLQQMCKSIDDFFESWESMVTFDESIKPQVRKDYFKRLFKDLALKFIERKFKYAAPSTNCQIMDQWMDFVEKLPAEERRIRVEDITKANDPKRHLAGRIAKFLDAPQQYHYQLESQKNRERLKHLQQHS